MVREKLLAETVGKYPVLFKTKVGQILKIEEKSY